MSLGRAAATRYGRRHATGAFHRVLRTLPIFWPLVSSGGLGTRICRSFPKPPGPTRGGFRVCDLCP
ncbi:hypothetical protein [Azospirillum largimobile]